MVSCRRCGKREEVPVSLSEIRAQRKEQTAGGGETSPVCLFPSTQNVASFDGPERKTNSTLQQQQPAAQRSKLVRFPGHHTFPPVSFVGTRRWRALYRSGQVWEQLSTNDEGVWNGEAVLGGREESTFCCFRFFPSFFASFPSFFPRLQSCTTPVLPTSPPVEAERRAHPFSLLPAVLSFSSSAMLSAVEPARVYNKVPFLRSSLYNALVVGATAFIAPGVRFFPCSSLPFINLFALVIQCDD